ncbi:MULTISPECIES: hypothetical protein [Nostocales]|jgi:hypothetical protein|uniref:Uncharacterized protein n=1 Tax=Aphanizomenon flos-aquae FACHB-1040 TaxID=2692887 RepID=A0ABR8BVW1_APHFL|nr:MULTISPECIES: hypothetical protein [Nostocales]MBD2277822.1 hypothetical protein [Aphanizomenon flos-aquae FACHB-1040]MBO1069763.1 hypothetical protein [Dolichospermum sp. DEX189]MTJ32642.1 hypothetical protein [Aphanizomenon sp. UHCC 0183]QSV72193.1 MAG: hypothetical protein HEQ20_17380 [Aphanizomenon flos-aquae KM1D3_PB]
MTLFSFDEIVKFLEQHENSKRIKKLIFFACKNEWENDQDTLDRFKLEELIQELSSLNPTINHLTANLSIAVKSLSKPKQYSIIASIIIKELQKLYPTSDEQTGIILNQANEEDTGIILNQSDQNFPIFNHSEKTSLNPSTVSSSISTKSQYDQFDLRQNLMRYTSPLRAKIILFSALDKKFTFNEEDWLKLKSEELDSLLQKLFDSCPTIGELESKINNTVISLGNLDKNNQASGVIIRVMRTLYGNMPVNTKSHKPPNSYLPERTKPPTNPNYQPVHTQSDDLDDYDDDDSNTCQITIPPT